MSTSKTCVVAVFTEAAGRLGLRLRHIHHVTVSSLDSLSIGCVDLWLFGSGSVIQDHSNHGTSKEAMNP